MSQPPRDKPPTRRVSTGGRPAADGPSRNVNAPRRSDPFPIVLGAIIGALVIGLLVVVYLISSGNTPGSGPQPTVIALVGSPSATVVPLETAIQETGGTPPPTEEPAPRMTLEDFKKLYDDPAKRPIIIDVRSKEIFDGGHIKGAISFPEADIDTRVGELPKDKLVVAYCQ